MITPSKNLTNNPSEHNFRGFSPESVKFLRDLGRHNERQWFEEHRGRYEKYLLEPFRSLVTNMTGFLMSIDDQIDIRPEVGKTISRIYRDTRFSKDKSPYRQRMWLVFKRPKKDFWNWGVGYYFELSIDSYRYGMGFGDATPKIMTQFRKSLDLDPKRFRKVINFYDKPGNVFELEGPRYQQSRYSVNDPVLAEWYDRKTFYLVCNRKIDDTLYSPILVDELIANFRVVAPLYHFMLEVTEQSPEEHDPFRTMARTKLKKSRDDQISNSFSK